MHIVRGRRRVVGAFAGIAAAAAMAVAAGAQSGVQTPDAATIVHQGNGRGAPACITCHGPKLLGNPVGGFPRLAGLAAPYILTQLDAFASGARKTPVMLPIATALSPAERQALAAYLSRLPVAGPMPAAPPDSAAPAPSPAALKLGRVLATRGRWSEGLPACDRCHGPDGVGVGTAFPPLAGQSSLYLSNQLEAWQQGTRPPGPLDLMSTIARRMSAADIAAVAAYYPTVPVTPPASGRSRP